MLGANSGRELAPEGAQTEQPASVDEASANVAPLRAREEGCWRTSQTERRRPEGPARKSTPDAPAQQQRGVRYRIDVRGISKDKVARRLGKTPAQFDLIEQALYAEGFPRADPIVGTWNIDAVDAWWDRRSGLEPEVLTPPNKARNAEEVIGERIHRLRNG